MGQGTSAPPRPSTEVLDGILAVPVVARIRRLLVVVAVAVFVYSFGLSASKGGCLGGVSAGGGFVDSDGSAIESAPLCYQLTLSPSPVVFLALAVIVFVALGSILSTARDTDHALRILDRAAIVAVAVVVGSIAIAYVWFAMIPVESWTSATGISFLGPFPFGSTDLEITTMSSP